MSSCPHHPAVRRSYRNKSKDTARIVIIGAGTAGIAAATRLLEKGFKHVQILEAESRIGGRINTISLEGNVIDLGAQWCHGEIGNVVYERVKDLDIVSGTGDSFYVIRSVRSNKQIVPEETAAAYKTLAEQSRPSGPDENEGSMGDYITQKYWQEVAKLPEVDCEIAKELFESFKKGQCSYEGCDNVFEVSGRNHLEYAECPGDPHIHWGTKGYKTFLRLLMAVKQDEPENLGLLNGRVHLNKRVAEINWRGDDELKLRCWNGELLTADHVICTVSLGVLKEQHQQLFVPALPEVKVRAIKGLKLGTVDKFYLVFAAQPMPKGWAGFYCLWVEEDLQELRDTECFWLESVSGFNIVVEQPRLLQGWITGRHARYMETLTEEEVLNGLQWLFRKFLPFNVPPPEHFLRSQWHSNPNFRGSYSFRTTYADELRTGPWDLAAPLGDVCGRPRLQFAGEATNKTHHSTVHGATESGWREADRLNDFYS